MKSISIYLLTWVTLIPAAMLEAKRGKVQIRGWRRRLPPPHPAKPERPMWARAPSLR